MELLVKVIVNSRWSFCWLELSSASPSAMSFLFAEKDVNRTDRTNRFYEGIDNPGLVLLHDILMTYCMYDFDLGEWRLLVTSKLALLDLRQVVCEHVLTTVWHPP